MKNIALTDRLTTREFWVDYWAKTKAGVVTDQVFFKSLLPYFPKAPASVLEIGGFPGSLSAYFKKIHNYDVTLLDYVIVTDIIREVEKINALKTGDIQTLEGDLFELTPSKNFDVVISTGFIEHFKNIDHVFSKHVEYLKKDGLLFVSIPNFKGISGYAQKCFDRHNYSVHNIDCMEKSVFEKLCANYNLEIKYLDYYGIPHMWLDHPEKVSTLARNFIYTTTAILMRLYRLFHGRLMNGRLFSPYIVLIAQLNK
ncbi:MAG: class I SAM-dependent methyltransferase [Bdellovibrionota bacterium]